MKKILTLTLALGISAIAVAQPAITYADHALTAGDVNQTRKATYVDPGASGTNVVWDFSACEITGDAFVESLSSSEGRILVTNKDNVVFKFDVTPYGNDYYGYTAPAYSMEYDKPMLKTRYPFTYLDQHSGEFVGTLTQGTQKTVIEGTYSSEVDAYGTLKLPNGITLHDVLRVKTTEVHKRFFCSVQDLTEVKYLWYSRDFRYPVFVTFQHTSTQNGKQSESQTSYVNVAALTAPVKVAEPVVAPIKLVQDVPHMVYPNPVANEATISYTLPYDAKVNIAVYNTASACVRKVVDGKYQDAGYYSYTYIPEVPGTYFVRFAFGDKVYVEQIVKK